MEGSDPKSSSGLRLAAQYEVARVLADAETVNDALPQVLGAVCNNLFWEVAAFWQVREMEIRCRHFYSRVGVTLGAFHQKTITSTFSCGQGLPGRIWLTQKLLWLESLEQAENFPRREAAMQDHLQSGVGVPIRIRDEIFGVLEFFSTQNKPRSETVIEGIESVASQLGQFLVRKRREEEIREREELYRMLTETAPDGIISIDQNSVIVTVNPAIERIFGYSAQELVGQSLMRLMPEEMASSHRAGIGRYLQTGKKNIPWQGLSLPGRRKDGTIIPLEIAFGETVIRGRRRFTGFIRDLSEIKRTGTAT